MEPRKHPCRIRELRESRNLTQSQLGQLSGYTTTSVSRHENGERSLDAAAIDRYANVFHITPVELFIDLDQWETMYSAKEAVKDAARSAEQAERERERLRIAEEEEAAIQERVRHAGPPKEETVVEAVRSLM